MRARMLISAFGPDRRKKMLDRLMKALGSEAANFDALQKADPQQLAKFIHSEHPQTIALILSHLNPSQAAGLLFSLPPEMRSDVVAAHGESRPDFSRDHHQDRGHHRHRS